jgi:putative DNA relaxase
MHQFTGSREPAQALRLGDKAAEVAGVPQGPRPAPEPPVGNTGAQNTQILPDWLGVTFKEVSLERVLTFFGRNQDWQAIHGAQGYRAGFVRGGVKVFHDGAPEMGVHVEVSGQGCRQLEAEEVVIDWQVSLVKWLEEGAKFSRLDLAIDDRAGLTTVDRVREAAEAGLVVSRWRDADPRGRVCLKTGQRKGQGCYFGSSQSKAVLRVYDKAAEQIEKGAAVEGPWVRWELQLRDERAQVMAQLLAYVSDRAAGETLRAVLSSYIEFKDRGEDTNRSRWSPAAWWSAFLGDVEKVSLGVAPAVRTLESVRSWFKRISPTFAAWVMAECQQGADFAELVGDLVKEGASRWRQSHRDLIAGAALAAGVG